MAVRAARPPTTPPTIALVFEELDSTAVVVIAADVAATAFGATLEVEEDDEEV